MNATDIPKFFHYDTALGVEAQYALEDLVRGNAKEEGTSGASKSSRSGKEEDGSSDSKSRKICWDFNGENGCKNADCRRIHKCKGCEGSGHQALKDCPKKKP